MTAAVHLDMLPPALRKVLASIGPLCTAAGFYLAGGTGLALWLGHRRSEDAYWFRTAGFDDPLGFRARLEDVAGTVDVVGSAPGTLHCSVAGVRVSFFHYPYRPLHEPVEVEQLRIRVACLADIAAMKLAAVAQRGSRKDFVDVHTLCREYRPLPVLLEMYRQRFGVADVQHVLIGLTYFVDADHDPDVDTTQRIRWRQVKKDLTRWVRELVDSS